MTSRLNTDRLLEMLMAADPSTSACDVVEQWRGEYLTSIQEAQVAAKQAAIDNPAKYGMKRIAKDAFRSPGSRFEVTDISGKRMEILRATDTLYVTANEIADFAHSIGVRSMDVLDMLEGRRLEVQARNGDVYRSDDTTTWSSSKVWRDTSTKDAYREMLAREDRDTQAMVDRLNADNQARYTGRTDAAPAYRAWSATNGRTN